ncbi:MAG: hypothetical protein HDR72_00890 [Ruminococcaceae bacterium]|nr:hypothetical protein [Oscillospiraceae bacterium]
MKKFITAPLAAAMALSLAACNKSESSGAESPPSNYQIAISNFNVI